MASDLAEGHSWFVVCLVTTLEPRRLNFLFLMANTELGDVMIYAFALTIPRWREYIVI
jgi:hypothetical protein